MALVLAFLSAENENRLLEDMPLADFSRLPERLIFVGRDKVKKEIREFCKLKITTIVLYCNDGSTHFPS